MPIALHRPTNCEPPDLNQTAGALSEFRRPLVDAVSTLFEYRLGGRSFEDISGLHLSLRPDGNTYKINGRASGYERTVLYADIYSANGEFSGERATLKILIFCGSDTKEHYLHEVAALFQSSKIDAPPGGTLPGFIDAGEAWNGTRGIGIIVTNFTPGDSLRSYKDNGVDFNERQLIEIFSTYAQHLAILETNGIIHGDSNHLNLVLEVSEVDSSINCGTIDLGKSSLPLIAAKQRDSRHKWAKNSEQSLKDGLDEFGFALAFVCENSNVNLNEEFTTFLTDLSERTTPYAQPNFQSFGELAECLQIAKEHVKNGKFHELVNLLRPNVP